VQNPNHRSGDNGGWQELAMDIYNLSEVASTIDRARGVPLHGRRGCG
jgi:hypothetical protein